MKILFSFPAVALVLTLAGCQKEDPDDNTTLPEGATPYTETDIQFVPYQSGNRIYKKLPLLDSTLVFQFKSRLRTEEYFAWDQTFFTFSTDPELEAEFRLRYLQTQKSQKTLAIYLPYRDAGNVVRANIFEIPITTVGLENGFFKNLVEFHDTITLNGIAWYNVFEINPLISTDAAKDGPENYYRAYYSTTYGLIQMNQNNGTQWLLQQ